MDPLDVIEREVGEAQGAREAIGALRLERELMALAVSSGVAPTALEDFLRRGAAAFAGDARFDPRDPTRRLTPASWARGLAAEAPHLFLKRRDR